MIEWTIYVALALFGAVFGSFAGASVWRLRAKQLEEDKKAGEEVDAKEFAKLKKLRGKSLKADRSQCLHCSYALRWYDLIPVVSWLSLKGKCRSCHKPIGRFELLMEIGVALFFVLSFAFWPNAFVAPLDIAQFLVWLLMGVVMAILFAYDAKWFLLPDSISFVFAGLAAVFTGMGIAQSTDIMGGIVSAGGAVLIMSGLYFILHTVSKGAWIGFGDVKLGIGLGLLLGEWQLALVGLFLANLIGTLVVIPLLASKKMTRKAHIPFGPFLLAGTVLAWFIGWPILDWYMAFMV